MKIVETLAALSAYPIPQSLINSVVIEQGLDPEAMAYAYTLNTEAYKRAKARVFQFLATAPNVSQNGISYSFSSDDKAAFRRQADALLIEIGDANSAGVEFGYQGDSY